LLYSHQISRTTKSYHQLRSNVIMICTNRRQIAANLSRVRSHSSPCIRALASGPRLYAEQVYTCCPLRYWLSLDYVHSTKNSTKNSAEAHAHSIWCCGCRSCCYLSAKIWGGHSCVTISDSLYMVMIRLPRQHIAPYRPTLPSDRASGIFFAG
jgi:hypothetical protein